MFKAGEDFFLDLKASFGALYGNDAYSWAAYVHYFCLGTATGLLNSLWYYVDNYFHVNSYTGSTTSGKGGRLKALKPSLSPRFL